MCKKCARKKKNDFPIQHKIKNLFSPTHNFPTSNMRFEALEKKKYEKRLLPHFYRFLLVSGTLWRSPLFILTPKIILSASHKQHLAFFRSLSSPSSYTHFFVMLHKHWAHRKIFIVMDRRYAFMEENFVSLEEEIFEKYFCLESPPTPQYE